MNHLLPSYISYIYIYIESCRNNKTSSKQPMNPLFFYTTLLSLLHPAFTSEEMYHPSKSIKLRTANKLMISVIHNRRRSKRTLRGLRKVNHDKSNKTTVPFSCLVSGKAASLSNSAASRVPQLNSYEVSSSSSSSSTTTTSPQDDHHQSSVSEGEQVLGLVKTEEQSMDAPTNTTISHGVISVIGRRRSMEDAVTIAPALVQVTKFHSTSRRNDDNLSDELMSFDFFAVYDGHGSYRVAQRCKERLHHVVAEQLLIAGRVDDWESVMTTSFARMEGEVAVDETSTDEAAVESTALVVMVGKEEIVVANCGDSRAVLFCDGAALPLSRDRKADGRDGVVNVIAVPEVTVHKRGTSEYFMVIASDGLWDVVSSETVCNLVKKCCSGEVVGKRMMEGSIGNNCAAASAAMLVELALARGSQDNISVIVVELGKGQGNAGSSAT